MGIRRLAAVAVLGLAAVAPAVLARPDDGVPKPAGTTFWFGANEARTSILFESETSVEVIHGITHTMSGTAALDMEKGEGNADLHVPVKSLDTGLAARNGHLQGEDWLDAAKFPEIVFTAKSIARKGVDEKKREVWAYEGEISIHGVTKALKGQATIQKIPAEMEKSIGPGSWIWVKTAFQVPLKEFGISVPEGQAAKVSPTWDIRIDIFGTTEKPKPRAKAGEKGGEKPAPKGE